MQFAICNVYWGIIANHTSIRDNYYFVMNNWWNRWASILYVFINRLIIIHRWWICSESWSGRTTFHFISTEKSSETKAIFMTKYYYIDMCVCVLNQYDCVSAYDKILQWCCNACSWYHIADIYIYIAGYRPLLIYIKT